MIVFRELLVGGGYIEHASLDTMPENADYIEVDKTLTPEEIQEINKSKISEYRATIYDITEKLLDSSKARALGKIGQGITKSQLDALEIFYTKKKDVAVNYLSNNVVTDQAIFELIQFEEANDFPDNMLENEISYLNQNYNAEIPTINITRLEQYCHLIVVKFSLGHALDDMLKSLCEIFRSKLITNLDKSEFEKIDQRIVLIKTITNETTIEQILSLKTTFDTI